MPSAIDRTVIIRNECRTPVLSAVLAAVKLVAKRIPSATTLVTMWSYQCRRDGLGVCSRRSCRPR